MTPKQKRKHIEKIKELLISKGFKEDRWGHFQIKNNNHFRAKMMKNNLRFEIKSGKNWFKCFSAVLVKIEIDKFSDYLDFKVKA